MRRVAVIDLGTHNCRMSIAEIFPEHFDIIRVYSKMVRLGEGASDSGYLQNDPMHRTMVALKRMADIIYEEQVTDVFSLATEGARMANNAGDFFSSVKARTGLDFNIIPPQEEVELSVHATAPLLGDFNRGLSFDIGGGSTEAVLFSRKDKNLEILDWVSLPLGVVRGRDRFGPSMDRETFKGFVDEVERAFTPFFNSNRTFFDKPFRVLGTSGTVTTLAALSKELSTYNPKYIDGQEIDILEAFRMARISSAAKLFARKLNPVIGPGRAEFLPSGSAIMEGMFRHIPAKTMIAADRGLREGMFFSLVGNAPRVTFRKGNK